MTDPQYCKFEITQLGIFSFFRRRIGEPEGKRIIDIANRTGVDIQISVFNEYSFREPNESLSQGEIAKYEFPGESRTIIAVKCDGVTTVSDKINVWHVDTIAICK